MTGLAVGDRLAATPRDRSVMGRMMCLGMLAVVLVLYTAFTTLHVGGIPIRAVVLGGFLALLVLFYPASAGRAVTRHVPIFVLAAAIAALGIFVSFANGASLVLILQAVLEVHVQICMSLIFGTIVAEVAGARASALVIVGAIALTAFVAMLQFAGVPAAWKIRETLGLLQGQEMHLDTSFTGGRPMGLSYSPIQLATQLCLAFAVYVAISERLKLAANAAYGLVASPKVVLAALLLVAFSIASATRSPILGAFMFLGVYLIQRKSGWLLALLLAGGLVAYLAGDVIMEAFASKQARVLRVDDDSAMGRFALWKFGMLLFADNPLGYGFGFIPASQYWMPYWHDLYTLQGADDIKSKELHNYVLIMINTYGIGLILIAPLVISLVWQARSYLIYFIPYVAHIMFHNSGPFWNDTLIWFVIGAISVAAASASEGKARSRAQAPRRTGTLRWR